jgi:hypothetical protein
MDRGFLIRGAGAGAAVLIPDWRWRAALLTGSYAGGWFGGEHGIQVVSVSGFELPTSALSWTAVHLAATAGLRRLPLPRPVTAAAYAASVAWLDRQVTASLQTKVDEALAAADTDA